MTRRLKWMAWIVSLALMMGTLCSVWTLIAQADGEDIDLESVEGYEPPPLEDGWYQISTPGHLLYMGNTWGKSDLPRDGKYRLANDIDMAGVQGFKPIGTKKENNFRGEFDGNYKVIYNLDVNMPGEKYVGFFGYLGEEIENSHAYNFGLVNINVVGTQNVGAFVGVSYGFIENCFAIGTVRGDDGTNGNAIGGFTGKNKGGEEEVIGRFYNCYFVGDVISESYSVGGMIGKEEGGELLNSWHHGQLIARSVNGSVGGMAGSFNAGNSIAGSVSMATLIEGARNIDKICGQLDDETGDQVIGNLAWEGTRLVGNEPAEQTFHWTDKTATELQSKQTYLDLGWDFDSVWTWYGSDGAGYPILQGFEESVQTDNISIDLSLAGPVINSAPVNAVKAGEDITVDVALALPDSADVTSVEVYYEYGPRDDTPGMSMDGTGFTQKVELIGGEGQYSGAIPASQSDYVYYYIQVGSNAGTITKPYDVSETIRVAVDDGTINGDPYNVVMSVGATADSRSINWLTGVGVGKSVVRISEKDGGDIRDVEGTTEISAIKAGFKEKESHKVTVTDLKPNTTYTYQVGDGAEFMSQTYEFTTDGLGDGGFTFIFTADTQSVEEEDFMTSMKVLGWAKEKAAAENIPIAFTMTAGDITQDGYKTSQWNAFFRAADGEFASMPYVPVVGNHDHKGDGAYVQFRGHFNVPDNGPDYVGAANIAPVGKGTVYSFEYGDALIAVLNSETELGSERAPFVNAQLEWLEEQVANTDKTWRIVFIHAGPYTSNHNPDEIKELTAEAFDRLQIDLVLNGHDHNYIRATAKGDQRVELGEGTTYVTGGTVGNKFYGYLERTDPWMSAQYDEFDQQIFSYVTVTKDSIKLTAYQKDDPEDDDYTSFRQIDEFVLTTPLSAGSEPGVSAPGVSEETGTTSSNSTGALVIIVLVLAVIIGVVVVLRKKGKA